MARRGTTTSTTGIDRARGFTFIEVVLVALVLTFLLVASLPSFQRTISRMRTETAAVELNQLLRTARARAVFHSMTIVWAWEPAAHLARLFKVIEQDDGEFSSQLLTGRSAKATLRADTVVSLTHEGSALGCGQAGDPEECEDCSCVRFYPDGTSEPGLLHVSHKDHHYTVTIDALTGQGVLAAGLPSS